MIRLTVGQGRNFRWSDTRFFVTVGCKMICNSFCKCRANVYRWVPHRAGLPGFVNTRGTDDYLRRAKCCGVKAMVLSIYRLSQCEIAAGSFCYHFRMLPISSISPKLLGRWFGSADQFGQQIIVNTLRPIVTWPVGAAEWMPNLHENVPPHLNPKP